MNRENHDDIKSAYLELIWQVAGYYNSTQRNVEIYRDMDSILLEELSRMHLMHWKKELHDLIFNSHIGGEI